MLPRLRALCIVAALALVAGACVSDSKPSDDVYGSPRPGASRAPKTASKPSKQSTTGGVPGATTRTSPGGTSAPQPSYRDNGGVGEMALAYLQAAPARRLVVEIDYARGKQPAGSALDHLRSVLAREAAKPDGVQVLLDDEFEPERDTYTFDDIARLEARLRNRHSGGSTAVMWMVSLNGRLAGDSGTLGVAYRASSIAVFPDEIGRAATALVNEAAIERSVLTHEAGHILGLVNIVRKSAYDHEDSGHPKHSKYQASVMYWVVEDVSITSLLSGGPPDDFDRYDRADLDALRRL